MLHFSSCQGRGAYTLHLLSGLRQLGGRALENLLENSDSEASVRGVKAYLGDMDQEGSLRDGQYLQDWS